MKWKKHPADPILTEALHGAVKVHEWRDPFVFTLGDQTYMVLGGNLNASKGGQAVVNLYEAVKPTSRNGYIKIPGLSIRLSISSHDVHRGDSVTLLATFFRDSSGKCVTEAAFLIYNASGIRISVIDLRHLLLDKAICCAEKFTIETRLDTFNLLEDFYRIGIYVMVGTDKFEYSHAEELLVRERTARCAFLPYPRHVRGFVELNAQSSVSEIGCPQLSKML